jgi:surface polysaccharide O-acyltransferase-like enzyme
VQAHAAGRLHEVDLIRAAALLGVVVIHAGAWIVPTLAPPSASALQAVVSFARFCVPAFVFASGMVLYRGHGGRPADPRAFLRRRWSRVIVPWLAWMPVFLVTSLALGQLQPDAGRIAIWLAYGAGHLYFLLLVAQLYLLLLVMPRSGWGLAIFAAAAMAVQLALMWLHTHGPRPDGALAWPLLKLAYLEGPYWAGYFALGCLVASQLPRLARLQRLWPVALAAALAATLAMNREGDLVGADALSQGTYAFLWPSRVLATLPLVMALLWVGPRLPALLGPAWLGVRWLSEHSLGLYLLQALVLAFAGRWTDQVPDVARFPLLLGAGLAGSALLLVLLRQSRLGAFALGESPPRRAYTPSDGGQARGRWLQRGARLAGPS